MLFADAFKILLLALCILIGYPAFWLVARGLWPNKVQQAAQKTVNQSFRCFLWGLIPVGVIALVGIGLLKAGGPGAFLGSLILGFGFFFSQVGVAGLATLIGEKLNQEGGDASGLRITGRGSLALVGTFLFPIIGWVLLPVVTMVIGFGAMIRTFSWKKKAGETSTQETAAAEPAT